MKPNAKDIRQMETHRSELKERLAQVGEMRPGTLLGRFRRCGKPNCHCALENDPGHGPSWSLTRQEGGKTLTRIIPANAVDDVKRQIAEHKRFRELVRDLVEVSIRISDAHLEQSKAASVKDTEKKGFARRLKEKSRKRSTN